MVKVSCHSGVPIPGRHTWPPTFQCRPEVGDLVQSSSGLVMKIVSIKHIFNCIAVELGYPNEEAEKEYKEINKFVE